MKQAGSQRLPFQAASSYKSYQDFVSRGLSVINAPQSIVKSTRRIDPVDFWITNRNYFIKAIMAMQKFNDPDQAEDIVQDLFIDIQEKSILDVFTDDVCAKRHCVSRCRIMLMRGQERFRYETRAVDAVFEFCEDKKDEQTTSESIDLVTSRFGLLSETQRKYIIMQFAEGYSVSETAKKIGVSKTTINLKTKQGLNTIRASFSIDPLGNRSRKPKPVNQLTTDGELIGTFPSIIMAHKSTGAPLGGICDACNNRQDTSGGFLWEFVVKN